MAENMQAAALSLLDLSASMSHGKVGTCIKLKEAPTNVHRCCRNTLEFCQTLVRQNSRFRLNKQNFVGPNFYKAYY